MSVSTEGELVMGVDRTGADAGGSRDRSGGDHDSAAMMEAPTNNGDSRSHSRRHRCNTVSRIRRTSPVLPVPLVAGRGTATCLGGERRRVFRCVGDGSDDDNGRGACWR